MFFNIDLKGFKYFIMKKKGTKSYFKLWCFIATDIRERREDTLLRLFISNGAQEHYHSLQNNDFCYHASPDGSAFEYSDQGVLSQQL